MKKILSILSAIILCMQLGGCAQNTAEADKSAAVTVSAARAQSLTVEVTSISDGVVTAVVGELKADGVRPDGAPGGMQPPETGTGGQPPEKPSGESDAPPQGNEDRRSERPGEGLPPDGAPKGVPFIAGTDVVTFTADEETSIVFASAAQSSDETASKIDAGDLEDVAAGVVLTVSLDENNHAVSITIENADVPGAAGGFDGSGASAPAEGAAATVIVEDVTVSDAAYASSGNDENALLIDGAAATLTGITVNKSAGSSSNTESGDFYGVNAGLLAKNGAQATIVNATVNTSAVNGNGIFSYGEGTTVSIRDSVIRTSERNSGGIQTAGNAVMKAKDLDVETQGDSAAAIRSDRGGGDVDVDGGSYVTYGTGSPAVYSTADIQVSNAALTACNSEAVVVEGKNSALFENCTLSGNMTGTVQGETDENIHNIMLYQSMSGDAAVGQSAFSAIGGSILSGSGDMFYVTNTDCQILLSGVELQLSNGVLLNVAGNSSARGWGRAGANGGVCTFTAEAQMLSGEILVDAISSLDLALQKSSVFTGSVNASGSAGTVAVSIEDGSTWTLTADSYITSFEGDMASVDLNGHMLYVEGRAAA